MSMKLNVRLKHQEGSLLRLLGQVGRRGYDVLSFSARLSADRKFFDVTIEFEPFQPLAPGKPRPAEVLPALVRKLVDVVSAELAEGSVGKPAAEDSGNGAGRESRSPKPTGEMKWEE